MAKGIKKTNAMRILDGLKIKYEVGEYEADTDHVLENGAALRMAEKLGVKPETVFKTIVMRTETKEICVFCQSAVSEINLKKARQAVGCKEIGPVKPEELLALTGYIRGGCTPIGMKRKYRTFIDKSVMDQEVVCVSGGVRGLQIKIAPSDLVKASDATLVDLVLEKE